MTRGWGPTVAITMALLGMMPRAEAGEKTGGEKVRSWLGRVKAVAKKITPSYLANKADLQPAYNDFTAISTGGGNAKLHSTQLNLLAEPRRRMADEKWRSSRPTEVFWRCDLDLGRQELVPTRGTYVFQPKGRTVLVEYDPAKPQRHRRLVELIVEKEGDYVSRLVANIHDVTMIPGMKMLEVLDRKPTNSIAFTTGSLAEIRSGTNDYLLEEHRRGATVEHEAACRDVREGLRDIGMGNIIVGWRNLKYADKNIGNLFDLNWP